MAKLLAINTNPFILDNVEINGYGRSNQGADCSFKVTLAACRSIATHIDTELLQHLYVSVKCIEWAE